MSEISSEIISDEYQPKISSKSKKKAKKKTHTQKDKDKIKKEKKKLEKKNKKANKVKLTRKSKKIPQTKLTDHVLQKDILQKFDCKLLKPSNTKKLFCIYSIMYAMEWENLHLKNLPILNNLVIKHNSINNIFSNNNFYYLDNNEISQYLPNDKIVKNISVKSLVSNECENIGVLDLFSTRKIDFKMNSSFVLNVGGPVWGLDWCPYTNYLIVSTHKNIDHYTFIKEISESTSGSFQVYKLNDRKDNVDFCFFACHQFSPVLALKFCPNNQVILNEDFSRIGLMAFCGCDHIVRIIIFPNPDIIRNSIKIGNPNIILKPFNENEVLDSPDVNYRALCFDWFPKYPHNKIAVGYSDGHISIFDIDYNEKNDSQLICYPRTEIQISFAPLITIKWYPHDDIIICGGLSDALSFVSLNERRTPIIHLERDQTPIFDLPYSSNCLIVFNDTRMPRPSTLRLLEMCHFKKERISRHPEFLLHERPIIQNCGTIKDIQSCPKTGFFCACDDLGKVYVCNFNERFLKSRGDYIFDSVIYSINCVYSIDDNPNHHTNLAVIFEDKNEIENAIWQMSRLTKEKVKGSGDNTNHYTSDKIISVNRIALNTTPGSLCWLASGGNLGLVRINCLSRWTEDVIYLYKNID